MGTVFGGLDIADLDDDGTTDVIAMTDGNVRNITYTVSTSQGNWGTPQLAYFGPYISYDLTVADLNGDGHPDFVNPTVAFQQDSTDSAGGTTSAFYLNYPSTVQVTLSSGANQHTNPLSYESGRRPNMAAVGQLAGDAQSAPDIAVGHTSYNFGNWVDNFGWEGQYDTITVVEMDNKDLAVTGLSVDPVDRWFGVAGEGSRQINVTVTNTGMDTLNTGSATVDVELKIVDEAGPRTPRSTPTTGTVLRMPLDVARAARGRMKSTWTATPTGTCRRTALLAPRATPTATTARTSRPTT